VTTAPLDSVRVISVGHTLPGLYCIAILRDLGADVTRVERLRRPEPPERLRGVAGGFPVRSLEAGTARCALDLTSPRGREVFRRLAARADVVLESFRPGTAARLGIDHATLAAAHPRLIYAAISGYGQDGPYRDRVGHDVNYLAAAGVLELAGGAHGPPALPGVAFADGLAGMSAALNVLAALRARERDGRGGFLDVAIVDAPLFLMSMEFEHYWRTGESRRRGDTHLAGAYPWYNVFETADGRYLSVGAVEADFYATLCGLIGHPELADEQRGARERMEVFRHAFAQRTRDEWLALLGDADACVAPVLTPGEAADAPHTARMRREAPGGGTPLVRSPVRLSPAPLSAGRTTAETLAAYGFAPEELQGLAEEGVIGDR
jgi:crotonobetainyl-CoA:carnitine CoA-transferase CaiB-like acyl-CoA transferase